jgi:hypothetical protein
MFPTAPYKPSFVDGPYLHWAGAHELQFNYLKADSVENIPVVVGKKGLIALNGRLSDKDAVYPVRRNPQPPLAEQQGIEKILILGDMHGMYGKLFEYLQHNKVIDQQGHWSWGSGHLVMSGDILDRGDAVTETLWFLYRLEQEAAEAGGAMHYLLGNHELMVMEGDLRYVSRKYMELFTRLHMSYADQFSKETVFGQWLRSRNTVICLNELLITHAGISPMLAKQGLSLAEINSRMKKYLQEDQQDSLMRLLRGEQGPLWYRGYLMPAGYAYDTISQSEVEQILRQYGASHMVVAHTTVDAVQARYHGKVFAVDLDVNEQSVSLEGLLYKKGKFFRLKDDAIAVEL